MAIKEPALADKIVALCKRGRLPTPFCVADIRKHFEDSYEDSHIRTVLANCCEGGYFYLKYGTPPRFERSSKGKYSCL
jgi:hypothetical protein